MTKIVATVALALSCDVVDAASLRRLAQFWQAYWSTHMEAHKGSSSKMEATQEQTDDHKTAAAKKETYNETPLKSSTNRNTTPMHTSLWMSTIRSTCRQTTGHKLLYESKCQQTDRPIAIFPRSAYNLKSNGA